MGGVSAHSALQSRLVDSHLEIADLEKGKVRLRVLGLGLIP